MLQVLISLGDGLAMVALASRVYQSSHASWAVACVFLAISVPMTALAPVAGLVLDRFPVRPVLVAAAAAEAVVALALTRLTGTGAILGLSVGFGLCAAVLQPGLGAIVPRVAAQAGVTRANGYLQAATWGGFTVGPLLAGVLTAAGGTSLALGAVAAVYGIGAVGLRLLRLAPAGPRPGPGQAWRTARRPGRRAASVARSARGCGSCATTPRLRCWWSWSPSWWRSATWPAWRRWPSPRECSRRAPPGTRCWSRRGPAGMLAGTLLGGLAAPAGAWRWPRCWAAWPRAPAWRWRPGR